MLTVLDLPTLKSARAKVIIMCDWLLQMFPYQNHHCHYSHYANQNFNTLSVKIIPENFPIIPGILRIYPIIPEYSLILFPTYYAQNYSGIIDSCLQAY